MAQAAGSISNPTTVLLGITAVTGVQMISWDQSRALIECPVANGETYPGVPNQGSVSGLSGSITFSNPILAQTFSNTAVGDLVITVNPMGAETTVTVTIQNVTPGRSGSSAAINSPSGCVVPFAYGSDDGSDPVAYS